MPIVNIIKKASNYILGSEEINEKDDFIYEDNEVLFCKNNICVHPPAFARQESDILHYPGYLTVTTKTFIDQYNNAKRPTLLLTWIPNATLRKCPSTVENNTTSIQQKFLDELKQNKIQLSNGILQNGHPPILIQNTNPFLEPYFYATNSPLPDKKQLDNNADDAISVSSSSDKASICNSVSTQSCRDDAQSHLDDEDVFTTSGEQQQTIKEETEEEIELKREMQPLLGDDQEHANFDHLNHQKSLHSQQSVTSVNITIADPRIQNHDISPTESVKQQNDKFLRTLSVSSVDDGSPNWMTPELFAFKHNLAFPDSATASPIVTRKVPLKCRR